MRKKILGINAFLFAALFGLISLNKEIIRPAISDTGIGSVLSGCFPNFIAAFLISLAFVSAITIRKPKFSRLIVYASSTIVFVILAAEELKPMWGASEHYDPFDILASGLGSILAILTFELLKLIPSHRPRGS